jgi:outer membrane receptor protein involved in Fe transport
MNKENQRIKYVIPVYALALCTGLFSCLAGQLTHAASEQLLEFEKFQVTGSHIQRTELEGVLPVVVLDRAAIDRSGATTVNELFSKVVYNTAGIVDEKFTQGFAPASAGIDLRGLGVSRTLTLIDGRRMPVFPFGQDGYSSFVDINLIPLSAIERVEILKDGASAIYGSDAIAGVVNIILRKDVEGLDFSGVYGETSEGDGDEGHVGLTSGFSGDRGNFTFGFDVLDRNPVWSKNRDVSESALGPIDDRSRAGNPGTTIRAAGFPEPDPRCPPDRINPAKGPFCLYDFGADTTLIPETHRMGLIGSGNYDITDTLNLFARANLTHSRSERNLAASTGLFAVSGSNPNTIYPGEDVDVIYRLNELGPRTDEFETDAYNLLAGVRGVVRDWDWELGAGWGKVDTNSKGTSGYATQTSVQNAVDDGTLNLYGPSPNLDADAVRYRTRRDGESTLYFFDFKAGADVMEMQHGPLSVALGAEYRNEDFSDEFDPVTESGDVLGIGGISSDGDRHATSAFLELSVPALRDVEVQLAGRYDRYSDFGNTFNPKLGVNWRPLENLMLRASAGTGFKAPTLQELYSEEIFSFESVFDPLTGEVVEVPTFSSGNRDLDAEESDNYSLGLVWDVTRAWDIGVDVWKIKNEDTVTNDPQFYVNNSNLFPENVIRDPNGDIVVVFSPFQNVAQQEIWGVDFDTSVDWAAGRVGDFRFSVNGSYLGAFDVETVEGEGFDDVAGDDGRPRVRGQGIIDWNLAAYQASLTVNYVSGYDRPDADDSIGDWTTFDTQFNWSPRLLSGGTVTLGADNVFNNQPPKDTFLEAWPFFNRALHNPRGRFLYLRYQHAIGD